MSNKLKCWKPNGVRAVSLINDKFWPLAPARPDHVLRVTKDKQLAGKHAHYSDWNVNGLGVLP